MTDTNLLQELQEDLQRQRMETLWKRYGMIVIGAAVFIVLATAVNSLWQNHTATRQQEASTAFWELVRKSAKDPTAQVSAFQDLASTTKETNIAVLARLRAASAAKGGDRVVAFEAVAKDDKVEPLFREYAALLAVQAQMDEGEPAALIAQLQPLMDKSVWRYSAREYAGYLALKAQDNAKAQELFTALAQDAGTPQPIAARARDMLRFLNGG